MFNLSEKDKDTRCHAKAKARGQKTFTLVEQDCSSPKTIIFWIGENLETCPPEKLHEALQAAIEMTKFPNRKHAD